MNKQQSIDRKKSNRRLDHIASTEQLKSQNSQEEKFYNMNKLGLQLFFLSKHLESIEKDKEAKHRQKTKQQNT